MPPDPLSPSNQVEQPRREDCGETAARVLRRLDRDRGGENGEGGGGLFCDVSLRCGSQSSAAHACVLAAASGFFQRVLERSRGQQVVK